MITYSLYLLYHPVYRRTYIGITTNTERRLRQHNRELTGGARSTSKFAPGWELVMYVAGFRGKQEAMRWEKLCKSRAVGLRDRSVALAGLRYGICPVYRRRPMYQVPSGLRMYSKNNGGIV